MHTIPFLLSYTKKNDLEILICEFHRFAIHDFLTTHLTNGTTISLLRIILIALISLLCIILMESGRRSREHQVEQYRKQQGVVSEGRRFGVYAKSR